MPVVIDGREYSKIEYGFIVSQLAGKHTRPGMISKLANQNFHKGDPIRSGHDVISIESFHRKHPHV